MQVEKLNESVMKVYFESNSERLAVEDFFTLHEPNYFNNVAFKKNWWDGRSPVFFKNDIYPIGLTYELRKFCEIQGISLTIKNREAFKLNKHEVEYSEYCASLDTELTPRWYQMDAFMHSFDYNKCFMMIATNAGKTFITYLMLRYLTEVCKAKKILFIVPRTNLLKQAKSDFADYTDDRDFLNMITYAGASRKPDLTKPIVVAMWQTLQNYDVEYFSDVDAIIVDEVHTAKAPKLKWIIESCNNAKYKFGYSGTLPSNMHDFMILTGLFGKFMHIIDAKELIEEGDGTPIEIHRLILNYTDKELRKRLNDVIEEVPDSSPTRELDIYNKRLEIIYTNPYRIKLLTEDILNRDQNTLVLYTHLDYAKTLRDNLKREVESRGLDKIILYLDGDVNSKYPELFKQFMDTLTNNDNVIMIATYKTFSTGVNNKNIHYCYFAQSTKSETDVIQSIGRLIRTHFNKKVGVVIDVVDDIMGLKHHAETRMGYYLDEKHHVVNIERTI